MKKSICFIALLLCCALAAPAFGGRLETLNSGTTKDLCGIDYHPDDSYALVVGDGVFTYDRASGLVSISSMGTFLDVDWHPQGDYALLVGEYGLLYKYDGTILTSLNSGVMASLNAVAFSPTGDQAVIVGYEGAIVVYDDATGAITHHSLPPEHFFEDVTWNPNGLTALIVGSFNNSDEVVVRYDRNYAVVEWAGGIDWPGSIAYHPTDDYALIVEHWGNAAIYDSNYYTSIDTGFEQATDGLNSVEWAPDGSMALITGATFHFPFKPLQTFLEFDGNSFSALRMFDRGSNYFEDVAWKSDSLEALVVGREGELALYRAKPSVMGRIHCDAASYNTGDIMSLYIDVENPGDAIDIDAYVTVNIDFVRTYYWPGFSMTPIPITRTIPAGASIRDLKFFTTTCPSVPWQVYVSWDLWLFETGSMDYNDLFSYTTARTVIQP
jgi:hypothetical protein